ncbi:MAG: glucose-6-phosphate isomerase family protein [Candidatus Aenigmatarchaeota archaeon]
MITKLSIKIENYQLYLNNKPLSFNVRKIKDLNPVLLEKNGSEEIAYYMYRDVYLEEHKNFFIDIRYDITIMKPIIIGKEYNKTFGHYHPKAIDNLSYPEVYEVLEGEALYILQSEDFKRVVLIFAKEGDQVIIPPNFGHVTVNIGKKDLIMCNLVYRNFESNYKPFEEKKGAAIYYTIEGIIENPNYEEFTIEEKDAKKIFSEELYFSFISNPEFFEFLINPKKFPKEYLL